MTGRRAWYLYIVSCSDNTLYTGITTDLKRRVAQHNAGKGAAYTASRRPVVLRAAWAYVDRSSALHAEHAMKRKKREVKLAWLDKMEAFEGGKPLELPP